MLRVFLVFLHDVAAAARRVVRSRTGCASTWRSRPTTSQVMLADAAVGRAAAGARLLELRPVSRHLALREPAGPEAPAARGRRRRAGRAACSSSPAYSPPAVPRSVLLLDPILLLLIMSGSRLAYRVWKEHDIYGDAALPGPARARARRRRHRAHAAARARAQPRVARGRLPRRRSGEDRPAAERREGLRRASPSCRRSRERIGVRHAIMAMPARRTRSAARALQVVQRREGEGADRAELRRSRERPRDGLVAARGRARRSARAATRSCSTTRACTSC